MGAWNFDWLTKCGMHGRPNGDFCGIYNGDEASVFIVADGSTRSVRGHEIAKILVKETVDFASERKGNVTNDDLLDHLRRLQVKLKPDYPLASSSYIILKCDAEGSHATYCGDCCLGIIQNDFSIEWHSKIHSIENAIEDIPLKEIAGRANRHVLTRSFKGRRFDIPDQGKFDIERKRIIIATDGFWADFSSEGQAAILKNRTFPSQKDDASMLVLSKEQIKGDGQGENLYLRHK